MPNFNGLGIFQNLSIWSTLGLLVDICQVGDFAMIAMGCSNVTIFVTFSIIMIIGNDFNMLMFSNCFQIRKSLKLKGFTQP